MRNRFNLNESDKSHIRALHGINEQSNNPVGRRKISKDEYNKIMMEAWEMLAARYKNKTVNLYTSEFAPGVIGDEIHALGSYNIDKVFLDSQLDEQSGGEDTGYILLEFKFKDYPKDGSMDAEVDQFLELNELDQRKGNIWARWACGDEIIESDNGIQSDFTNVDLLKDLNNMCKNEIKWKEYDKLFSPNGNYIIVDTDVDFSMGDDEGSEELV